MQKPSWGRKESWIHFSCFNRVILKLPLWHSEGNDTTPVDSKSWKVSKTAEYLSFALEDCILSTKLDVAQLYACLHRIYFPPGLMVFLCSKCVNYKTLGFGNNCCNTLWIPGLQKLLSFLKSHLFCFLPYRRERQCAFSARRRMPREVSSGPLSIRRGLDVQALLWALWSVSRSNQVREVLWRILSGW